MMIILFLCLCSLLFKFSVIHGLDCLNQITVPCAFDASTKLIYVNGYAPAVCTQVQINSVKYIFDKFMINAVWITISSNTNGACRQDIAALPGTIGKSLNLPATQEVALLDVTELYYRFVVLPTTGPIYTVIPINSTLESQLQNAKMVIYNIYNDLNTLGKYCLNGGSLDTSYTGAGYKCICGTNSIYFGPRCEYMESTMNSRQNFFNVFRSAANITLRFSLFSTGIPGTQSILTIKNSNYMKVVEITVMETSVTLRGDNNNFANIIQTIDNQNWFDFVVTVNGMNATLSINSKNVTLTLTTTATADFRSFYFVLDEPDQNIHKICIRNMLANSRIVDLNNPLHASCCKDRCPCNANQGCDCRPFVSGTPFRCYCNFGYQSNSTSCIPSTLPYSQITSSVATPSQPVSPTGLNRMDFGFRTLSTNGILQTLIFTSPPISVSLQIVNTNLTLVVPNQRNRIINFNVSNGEKHTVTLIITNYSLTVILDSNYNYSITLPNWFNGTTDSIVASTFTTGPMQGPSSDRFNNLTTCFSAIQFNIASSPTPVNVTTDSPQCSDGLRCSSVTCPTYQICNDTLWQRTQCIANCPANYINVNNKCTYYKCLPINPCQNNGVCDLKPPSDYGCNCTSGYSGTNCEVIITQASVWWVAILIVLLLLLIILIILLVYCCCFAGGSESGGPLIAKINENIVVYNDQAGEADYNGPPINFTLLKNALDNKNEPRVIPSFNPIADLMAKKKEFDNNNNDLILDHPLEYGFEGDIYDHESISSIGSKSDDGSALDVPAVDVTKATEDVYNIYS